MCETTETDIVLITTIGVAIAVVGSPFPTHTVAHVMVGTRHKPCRTPTPGSWPPALNKKMKAPRRRWQRNHRMMMFRISWNICAKAKVTKRCRRLPQHASLI